MVKRATFRGEKRADLTFPVGRFKTFLTKNAYTRNCSITAAVYLAGCAEYLCGEILEICRQLAIQRKKTRIVPRMIMLAIENDPEIKAFFHNSRICNAGIPQSNKQKRDEEKEKKKQLELEA